MQKNKDKSEKKPLVKKEADSVDVKNKSTKEATHKEKIDEQNSDGSAGAFGEFIDQQRD